MVFLESVYENAMVIALRGKGLYVEQQYQIPVWFRGNKIGSFYADLIIDGKIIIELKAVRSFARSTTFKLSQGNRDRSRLTAKFRRKARDEKKNLR